jgi:hypothetical protein
MALRITQPLTEMSTGYMSISGGKALASRRADNLAAICEPTVRTMWDPQHPTTLEASRAS